MNPWTTIAGPIIVAGAIVAVAIYGTNTTTAEKETSWQVDVAEKLGALSTLPDRIASLEAVMREGLASIDGRLLSQGERLASMQETLREIATANVAQDERLASIDKLLSSSSDMPFPVMILRPEDYDNLADGGSIVVKIATQPNNR